MLAANRWWLESVGVGRTRPRDYRRNGRGRQRIHALLAGIRLGAHVHLLERAADGDFATEAIDQSERAALAAGMADLDRACEPLAASQPARPPQTRDASRVGSMMPA